MQDYKYIVADVFTDRALEGNPVAVFPEASGLSSEWMQRIANEMHLSESVFVLPPENGGDVRVRIFTPVNELRFAGHPTLGTAIVLGESHLGESIRMETAMGTVPFDLIRSTDLRVRGARMLQPIPTWEPYDRSDDLLTGLGLAPVAQPIDIYCNGPRHVFIGFASVTELSEIQPDLRILAKLPDVAVNCYAGSGVQWRMRMFSPAYGVVEDAATGSAAGALAIHLARLGLIPMGQRIEIRQGVEIGRPSTMQALALGALDRIESVEVAGSATVVARGTLYL